MAIEYASIDQGVTYHICDPGGPGYCGAPIVVDVGTLVYTDADVKRDSLELSLCEACWTS